jgi:L-amino acid N-acyltransferase YncA
LSLTVRPSRPDDAPALAAILNAIIAAGGTTAHEEPFSPEDLRAHLLDGPAVLCCHTVLDGDRPAGFQSLTRAPYLPPDWAEIATFTRRAPPLRGAGAALWPATRARAVQLGIATIDATIRADNLGGLAYYARIGFVDYAVLRAVQLRDGTPVDRIRRRHDLA